MLLNEDIVDIEKRDGICLLIFVADEFLELFLHPSIFSIIQLKSPQIINGALSYIIKSEDFSVFRKHNYIRKIFLFTYVLCNLSLFFVGKE